MVHLWTGIRKEFFEGLIMSFGFLSKYWLYTELNVNDKSDSNWDKDFYCNEFWCLSNNFSNERLNNKGYSSGFSIILKIVSL